MTAYATLEEYAFWTGESPTQEETAAVERQLLRASRAVDGLTFGRISAQGFDRLTQFQQELVSQVTAQLAAWQLEHADLLESPLSGYSINGVTAQYGETAGVVQSGGVLLPRALYALLEQTGLCCRRLP